MTLSDDFRFVNERIVACDNGRFPRALQFPNDLHELPGKFRVEVRRGLVGDDRRRVIDERPGDRNPLHFSSGQQFRLFPRAAGDRKEVEKLERPRLERPPPLAEGVGGQHDVLQRGDPLDEVELLEDEPERPAPHIREKALGQARDVAAGEHDPPRRGTRHAPDDAEEGGLAGAARPLEDGHLARLQGAADPVERDVLVMPAGVEDLADVLDFNHKKWSRMNRYSRESGNPF